MQNLVSLALTWNGDLHDCVGRPVGHAEYVDGEVYPPVLVVAVGEVVLHVLPESRVDVSAQLHVLQTVIKTYNNFQSKLTLSNARESHRKQSTIEGWGLDR